jgi:hypothetical protein
MAAPLSRTQEKVPDVPCVPSSIPSKASLARAPGSNVEAQDVLQQAVKREPPTASPSIFEVGAKRRAMASTSSSTSSSIAGSPNGTPGKAARLGSASATAMRPSPTAQGGQPQKLEFELTKEGGRSYNICGMRFEVTADYSLTRAVGQASC